MVNDEWGQITLNPFCTDMNSQGLLLADATHIRKEGDDSSQDKHSLRRYNFKEMVLAEPLEGEKEKLRFFKDQQIVELKPIKNGSM